MRISNPILSYNIEDQYGNIIFKFPPGTLLEKIVDVWQIIIYYYFYYFDDFLPFALKIMDDDKLNPTITYDMCKVSYDDRISKYEKDFPKLKSNNKNNPVSIKRSFSLQEVGKKIYRPLTIKEVQTISFLRLFNDACKNDRILFPRANKNGNAFTIVEVEQIKIMINFNSTSSYLFYDNMENKFKTYDADGYHDISGNIHSVQPVNTPSNTLNGYFFEQLLVLSNIKFY